MATSMPEGNSHNFIKIVVENIGNIRQMCAKYKNKDAGIEAFAERSIEKLEELEKKVQKGSQDGENSLSIEQVKECVQLYAQVLLDVTFCEENILVDGVFPEKNAAIRVQKLLTMLRQPEVICQHCYPTLSVKELLGEEILECLLWRRGALLYMYCHTIQEDNIRLSKECSTFIENCKDGALYLRQMLNVRRPLQEERHEVITSDEDMFDLLKKGVFSETHVLSLLYAGELCYWHVKHRLLSEKLSATISLIEDTKTPSPSSKENRPPSDKGEEEENSSIKSQASEEKSPPSKEAKEGDSVVSQSNKENNTDDTSKQKAPPNESPQTDVLKSPAAAKNESQSYGGDDFSAKEVGSQLLSLYLDIVQGPLKNHGWRLERASELLSFIQHSDAVDTSVVENS